MSDPQFPQRISLRARAAAGRTFRSLRIRNYRLYFWGQVVSMTGTWVQSMALIWLVYELTGSGVALGVVTGLQFLPILVAGVWGGVVADRSDKRRLLVVTQSAGAAVALLLWGLTVAGAVDLWMVYALAFAHGCVIAFDVPARQSFVIEMVGPDDLSNAVALNSTVFTSARAVGPAIAGVVIPTLGVGVCFAINALSFGAVIAALAAMDPRGLQRSEPAIRAKGQLREGLRYAFSNPDLRDSLFLVAVIGTIAFNFRVLLPLMAEAVFGGGPGTFGALSATMGAGTVAGALLAAGRAEPTRRFLIASATSYGGFILAAGAAPTLATELVLLVPMGAAGIAFVATANATLQLASAPAMRARVMALYSVVFLGSTPIGGPLIGWVAEILGPRAGFAVSGAATLAAALVVARRGARAPAPVEANPAR